MSSDVLALRGISKSFGAVQARSGRQHRVPRRGDPRARRGERVREVDVAGRRQRVSRPRRRQRRDRRHGAPASLPGRDAQARPRHGLPDVLARARPVGGRKPLSGGARRATTDVRAHGGVGGGAPLGVRARHPAGSGRRIALARAAAALRGRQGVARRAEGAAPRRADDGARAGGRRAPPCPRRRAEPCRRRDRVREPPAAGGPEHRRPCHASCATGSARGRSRRRRCRRTSSSR